jgi:hypothetical protein
MIGGLHFIRLGKTRRRPAERLLVAIATASCVAAALAGCTGNATPADQPGSGNAPTAVGYSHCIRAHGVPNFPDPGSAGKLPKASAQQLGVSSAQLATAERACQSQLPDAGNTQEQQAELACATSGSCSAANVARWMSGLRTLAKCLRSHGTPNWPDPILSSQGLPEFNYDAAGIDHHSSQILAEVQQCIGITGFAGLPLPSYTDGHGS